MSDRRRQRVEFIAVEIKLRQRRQVGYLRRQRGEPVVPDEQRSQRAERAADSRRYRWLGSAAAAVVLAVVAVAFVYWRTPATAPSADRPSIAVLPFTIGSADTDQGYLSEGLAEDLTTNLSRFGELFVVAHQSAKQFKDKPFEGGQIGRELGVRYLLTGSIRRDASRVRITAQLVNAATAHQLWAETYDREISDFFAIQDEVTQRIREAIELCLEVEGEPEQSLEFIGIQRVTIAA